MLNITIIGMGLIGTSLGMALRSAAEEDAPLGPTVVTGFDLDPRMTSEARGRLAIDRQSRDLADALHEADLVVVAVPALATREVFSTIAPLLPHGTVVTDVISTKAQVVAWARELLPNTVSFVGGHPMAGSEQSGPAAATRDLFKGAIYCLTPDARTRPEAIDLVDALVRQVGAKPYYIDAAEHDGFVAGVSHLPFLLSTGLMQITGTSPSWREMSPLAASGFRDITRLASGDTVMHRDICLTNAEALVRWIDATQEWLAELRDQLNQGDSDALLAMFKEAQENRATWLAARPNARPGEEAFENFGAPMPERRSIFGFGRRDSKR